MESDQRKVDGETYAGACMAGTLAAAPSAFLGGLAAYELAMAFNNAEHLARAISCTTALALGWLAFLKVKNAVITYFSVTN